MSSKPFLNEALQIGPWRVKRKHLLFVIAFSFFVVLFGIFVLQTHIFDSRRDDYEEDEDDDDDEDDSSEGEGDFASGDWLMMVIMTLSGILAVTAAVVCFLAKKNAPSQLRDSPQSVYAVQYNKDSKSPINSIPRASYTTPQPISLIAGHIVQQIQAQQKAAQANGPVGNAQESQIQHQQNLQQLPPQQVVQQLPPQQIAPQHMQHIVQQPAQQIVQQPAQQIVQQPTQQVVQQPTQQIVHHQSHQVQQPIQRQGNITAPRIQITSNPSAPNQITVELPPPYSP